MTTKAKKLSLLEPSIVVPAIGDSFRKLDPRTLIRNPVMFAVEIVAAAATLLFLRDLFTGSSESDLHRADQRLAVVHGAVRQLLRGGRRGPRQGAGRHPAQDALGHGRQGAAAAEHGLHDLRAGAGERSEGRAGGAGGGRRSHPRRRRDHRGRGHGQRIGHHRRVGAGHPRERRRPLGRHRWHDGPVGLDQDPHHRDARARASSTA